MGNAAAGWDDGWDVAAWKRRLRRDRTRAYTGKADQLTGWDEAGWDGAGWGITITGITITGITITGITGMIVAIAAGSNTLIHPSIYIHLMRSGQAIII
jgi:hypothetical protein